MKITLAQPDILRDSISTISELVSEVRFKVNATALEMIAMDAANISMIIFKMFSSACIEYKVDGESELAINLLNLKKILRRAKKTDILSLELSDDSRLKVMLKGKVTRTFFLPLIDIEESEQKLPELEFKATVKTSTEVILDAIDDADIVSESVMFLVKDGVFSIEAKGDTSKVKVDIPQDDDTSVACKEKEVKSKYSIEYLKKMISSKLSEKIDIRFSADYPLRIEFVEEDKIQMVFILAPRVETE
jgi:proliferating cell nuclear antigen